MKIDIKKILGKAKSALLVWGKPIIREAIKSKLMPMIEKAVNDGSAGSLARINKAVEDFIKKYL